MARDTAGKWVIGCLIYFLLLAILITSIADFPTLSTDGVTSSGGLTSLVKPVSSYCDAPREQWTNDRRCDRLLVNEGECDSLSGCSWTNTTTFLWYWEIEVPAYCEGTLNVTDYGWTGSSIFDSLNVCELSNVSTDRDLCQNLGCTWVTSQAEDEFNLNDASPVTLIRTIGDVFTLDVTFTTNNTLNNILTTFIIIIPYLILILAIIMLTLG